MEGYLWVLGGVLQWAHHQHDDVLCFVSPVPLRGMSLRKLMSRGPEEVKLLFIIQQQHPWREEVISWWHPFFSSLPTTPQIFFSSPPIPRWLPPDQRTCLPFMFNYQTGSLPGAAAKKANANSVKEYHYFIQKSYPPGPNLCGNWDIPTLLLYSTITINPWLYPTVEPINGPRQQLVPPCSYGGN